MKKLLLTLSLAAFLGIATTGAQTKAEIDQSVTRMESSSAPCNQGTEPFKQFIAKFSTDKSFMESRLKLTDAQMTEFAELLTPANFMAMGPVARDNDEWYQAWDEIQRNSVYLSCGWVDSFTEHIYEFKRIGEKWYLAKVVVDNN